MTTTPSTDDALRPRAARGRGYRVRLAILAILALLALLAIAFAVGSDRTAAPGLKGTGFEGPASSRAADRLRLATFNVHAARDAEGRSAWDRAVETLRGFDLIGLQEVRGPLLVARSQAERFGRALGMPWCFAPSERRHWRGHFGNAVLTTLPVRRWESVPLANTRGKGYRNYVRVEVDLAGRAVTVLVTHIDRRDDRVAQLTHVGDVFLALPAPAILIGDLNCTADDPALRRILDTPDVADAHAGTLDPGGHIDWILVRGLTVVEAGVIDRGASDHPCLWAELR